MFHIKHCKFYQELTAVGLLLPLVLMFSCVSVNKNANEGSSASYSSLTKEQILEKNIMLGFTLVEDPDGDSIYLHYHQMNPGSIIEKNDSYEIQEGDLILQFLSPEGNTIKTVEVKDPSVRIIETFSETGNLEVYEEDTSVTEFFIRLNYSQDLAMVRIYRIQNSGNQRLISSILIPQE